MSKLHKYNNKIVALTKCDECKSEITEFCDNHKQVICESCHLEMIQECIDDWGAACRDNYDCQKVDVTVTSRRSQTNEVE